ncbi:MAG TPA: TetR/AcrR family transcriptional regulator [Pseudonocardiaceae bacterium]|nr:TetR/AcrR family transcriptional regulator [Pseudonocardiaceae bacterium]
MSRNNQKQRTRLALIDAAVTLARQGRSFSVAEVADAAMVSTATAYRYFPNPQSLWVELAVRQASVPNLTDLIDAAGDNPADRVDAMVSTGADMQLADEALWRAVLKATLDRWTAQHHDTNHEAVPVRSDSRLSLTQHALAPLADQIPPALLRKLTMAVMLVCGVEAMITTRDGCHLDPDEAKQIMRWAAQALIRSALTETTNQ